MRTDTDIIRQTLRLLKNGLSQRRIAKNISISRQTISTLKEKLMLYPIEKEQLLTLTDSELLDHLHIKAHANYCSKKIYPDFHYIHQELKKRDMTLRQLWEEYIAGLFDVLSYSQFCRMYNRFRKKKHHSMRQHYTSGEVLLVDFCGRTMLITSPVDGKTRKVQIFVAVLGASGYIFAFAVESQKVEDWLKCFIAVFNHIGGVPQQVVTDNLKAAVIRNNKKSLEFQKDFEDFAAHYDFAIIPTRPREPTDKGLVEVSVQIIQRSVLVALRNQKFFTLNELNHAIQQHVDVINAKTTKRFTISRLNQFFSLDQKDLQPLPLFPYELCTWKRKVRVSEFYRVEWLTNQYSVPYTYAHSHVDLKITTDKIIVYCAREQIAEHKLVDGIHQDIYLEEHMSLEHKKQHYLSKDEIKKWAVYIGNHTAQFVDDILSKKRDMAINIRSLNRLRDWAINQEKSHDLEQACAYAIERKIYSIESLKKIISNRSFLLSTASTEPISESKAVHKNIRGVDYYSKFMETTHA